MPKVTLTIIAAGAMVFLMGCHSMHRICTNCLTNVRDHCDAKVAWWDSRDIYADCERYLADFGDGFQAGYRNVAAGKNGCPPPMPPQKYYGVCYQNEAGKKKVIAWYNGWSHGVYAAECDGVRERSRIPTAHDLYGAHQNAPVEFDLSQFQTGVEPAETAVPFQEMPNETPPQFPAGIVPPVPADGQ